MIDPLLSLSFVMQSNKGVYALLLGSGVSRAAQIPTGWEIVLDLVGKLAHMQGEPCEPDASAWYREKYGEEPDYSKLLDAIAKSPEERQQLLRTYFEPNEEERDQKLKSPTAAHRAIASLVARGYIRVILTTNFDRLIERAIDDEGITPTVLSTPDAIEGALPLVHQGCYVIKLHGDYLDTRIKNTPVELEAYHKCVNELLDRVLDEFGVITCGWSAQWDPALVAAFERCKSRRFTLYWPCRGDLGERAKRLIDLRAGVTIKIKDADTFFTELKEKVIALEEMGRSHPLTSAAMAATVKRLLSDSKHNIRLHDLIQDETEAAYESLQPFFQSILDDNSVEDRFSRALSGYLERIELVRIAGTYLAYWGNPEHFPLLTHVTERLAVDPWAGKSGRVLRDDLRLIPAVVFTYTIGIAAMAQHNLGAVFAGVHRPVVMNHGERRPLLTSMRWWDLGKSFKQLPDYEQKHFPASEWLYVECRSHLKRLIPDDSKYDWVFDQFEIARSFMHLDLKRDGGIPTESKYVDLPPGRFAWKWNDKNSPFREAISENGLLFQLIENGLFRGRQDSFSELATICEQATRRMWEKYYF